MKWANPGLTSAGPLLSNTDTKKRRGGMGTVESWLMLLTVTVAIAALIAALWLWRIKTSLEATLGLTKGGLEDANQELEQTKRDLEGTKRNLEDTNRDREDAAASLQHVKSDLENARRAFDLRLRPRNEPPPSLALIAVPAGLRDAYQRHECYLFSGTGLSYAAGYPRLIEIMGTVLGKENDAISLVRDDFIDEAVTIVMRNGQGPKLVAEARLKHEALSSSEGFISVANSITGLVKMRGFISTAFDEFLPTILKRSLAASLIYPHANIDFGYQSRILKPFVARLAGAVEDDQSQLLFDSFSIIEEIQKNKAFADLLKSILLTKTVLFFGIERELIERVLAILGVFTSSFPAQPPRHYAVLSGGRELPSEASFLSARFGIELIGRYDDSNQLRQALSAIRVSIDSASSGVQRKGRPIHISRLELEGIGRFQSLSLDFNERANVLVGENGTGKSTLLRAIVGACSSHDQSSHFEISQLLSPDRDDGSICLWIDGQPYQTGIKRRGPAIEVLPPNLTPIESKQIPVFAFPATRGARIAARSLDHYFASPSPESGDILPVLHNRIDDRIADVKRWIVDEFGSGMTEKGQKYSERLAEFLGILEDILGGARLDIVSFDPAKLEIVGRLSYARPQELETREEANDLPGMPLQPRSQDGLMALDQLSDGVFGTLGWLGVVVKRLYEVYPESNAPCNESFVLIVDELDAHLHPAWQRRLLDVLKRRFPQMQLISSTHSPLVVGGADAKELFVMSRPYEAGAVTTFADEFPRMSVDEVLSFAFDMSEVVSPNMDALRRKYHELSRHVEAGNLDANKELDEVTKKLWGPMDRVVASVMAEVQKRQLTNVNRELIAKLLSDVSGGLRGPPSSSKQP